LYTCVLNLFFCIAGDRLFTAPHDWSVHCISSSSFLAP
jgi:hypothetical protein